VSCRSATACTAVGSYFNNAASGQRTLAEAWKGKKWALEPTPNPTGDDSELGDVSCTSASACSAVGFSAGGSTYVTLAEAWNGKKWAIEPTPNPIGAQGSFLSGVSCTSATACTAVEGYTNRADADVTLAEAWNGEKWKIERTPNPTGASDISLSSVSCTSTKACTAVGTWANSAGAYFTFAEGWNGRKWKIEP
jgi:hypothetical protein